MGGLTNGITLITREVPFKISLIERTIFTVVYSSIDGPCSKLSLGPKLLQYTRVG